MARTAWAVYGSSATCGGVYCSCGLLLSSCIAACLPCHGVSRGTGTRHGTGAATFFQQKEKALRGAELPLCQKDLVPFACWKTFCTSSGGGGGGTQMDQRSKGQFPFRAVSFPQGGRCPGISEVQETSTFWGWRLDEGINGALPLFSASGRRHSSCQQVCQGQANASPSFRHVLSAPWNQARRPEVEEQVALRQKKKAHALNVQKETPQRYALFGQP